MSNITPSYREAFSVWLRIGLTSFGGPAGQIALMHRVLVEEKKWVDEARFLHGLNFCMMLPGPEAMQLATYIGWRLHGLKGGLTAGTLFVLPGFLVILSLSAAYATFQSTPWFASLFFGLKAAVLAIVAEALLRVSRRSLKGGAAYGIALASFLALFVFGVAFPLVVLASALAGVALLQPGQGPKSPKVTHVIPQDSMASPSPIPNGKSASPVLAAVNALALWGGLWSLGFAAALALGGGLWWDLSVFFSKMAVVTFGGAYAVLAYVAQAVVETLGWLKPGQMIDGLALAETTPGPLILVLTYVGFLAGYQNPGALPPLLAGAVGATLTTWVTFIPCFLWIFLGAPWIDRLAENARLKAALAGIGAGVVGVILNLSLWFALQTLFARVGEWRAGPVSMAWPEFSTLNLPALALTLVAFLALFRLRLGMGWTMALCGGLGVAAKGMGW
jgi:chromate transporter